MEGIHYLLGLYFLFTEINVIFRPKLTYENYLLVKDSGNRRLGDWNLNLISLYWEELIYVIWCIMGLFYSQWLLMLLYIIFGIYMPRNKPKHFLIDGIISALFISFYIINKFVFHLNFNIF